MIVVFHDSQKRPYASFGLHVADESMTLRMQDDAGRSMECGFALPDLRKLPWWADCNVLGLDIYGGVVPLRAECLEARQHELYAALSYDRNIAALLYVPDTEATFADMGVVALTGPETVFDCNVPVSADLTPDDKIREGMAAVMPRLTLDGPDTVKAGETAQCTVRAALNGQPYPWLLDVRLDHVNGVLPKTRLRVGDAPVSFSVLTVGLEAGDRIKLKAGFRYLVAQAEKTLTLVD